MYRVEDTHWWFVGRRAIVFDELSRLLAGRSDRPRVLDLGCGTGRNLVDLQALAEPVGLDIEHQALTFCRERGSTLLVRASAESLPFQAESFDMVMALDLLEHLDDDVAGAAEILRVLRPGGSLIAFVPAYRWLWGPQDDLAHHRRRYTPRSIRSVMRDAGFQVARVSHANLLLLPLILLGRRYLRLTGRQVDSENTLHPAWSNGLLRAIFTAERHVLRRLDLALGVSILCVARKDPAVMPAVASAPASIAVGRAAMRAPTGRSLQTGVEPAVTR
jgi:SAM-dependent methyltransferase